MFNRQARLKQSRIYVDLFFDFGPVLMVMALMCLFPVVRGRICSSVHHN